MTFFIPPTARRSRRRAPFLRGSLTHRRMREGQIAACLTRGDDAVPAIIARLYAGLAPMLIKAAELTVLAHLQHMMEDGRVAQDGARYRMIAKAP